MSDWQIRAKTPIQEQLYLQGFRIVYTPICRYEAREPGGQCIKISDHVDDCWQACYEHFNRFMTAKHHTFAIEMPEGTVTITADPNMSEETYSALIEMIRAAQKAVERGHFGEVSDGL